MPNNAQYRYACLKGDSTGKLWSFLNARRITSLIAGESNQTLLADNLRICLASTPLPGHTITHADSVILLKEDNTCSARAILFGLLISASIAIKNHAKSAESMKETLNMLYAHAIELRTFYQNQCSELILQSQAYPMACNSVIAIIQAVYHDQISTTELIYQANKDCMPEMTSTLNMAFTDLSHYLLWKAASNDLETTPNYPWGPRKAYTPNIISVICSYLKISIQTLFIEPTLIVRMTKAGRIDYPAAFTTVVNASGHATLLLDAKMRKQILLEYPNRKKAIFDDIELRYTMPGVQYHPVLSPENELCLANDQSIQHYEDAYRAIREEAFPDKLVSVCDLFISTIRQLTWQIEQHDVLFELEEVLYRWHTHLINSPDVNHPVINANKLLIRSVLDDIYRGERGTLPALFNDVRELNVQCSIGGTDNPAMRVSMDLGVIALQPKDYQAVLVLMKGINRTRISLEKIEYPMHLNTLVDYLVRLMELPFMTKEMREIIQSSTRQFFTNEINNMPQHAISVGQPGYSDYLNEMKNIDQASRRFNTAWNDISQVNREKEQHHLHIDRQFPTPTKPPLMWPVECIDFSVSIQNTEQCRTEWLTRLGEYELSDITAYFQQVAVMIQALPNEDEAAQLIKNLDWFANTLHQQVNSQADVVPQRESMLFAIKIMMDTAKKTLSPTVTQRHHHLHTVKMNEAQRLPGDLEKIRARKKALSWNPVIETERVIQFEPNPELHPVKPILFANRTPTPQMNGSELILRDKNTEILLVCVQQLVEGRGLDESHFNERFAAFNHQLLLMLKNYPDEKESIVNDAIIRLRQLTPTKVPARLTRVSTYLERLIQRIHEPIMNAGIASEFKQLIERYSKPNATTWQAKKHDFLVQLQSEIQNHPEKTYQSCIQTVRDDPNHDFNALFSVSRNLRNYFFSNSSVGNVVDHLETLDFCARDDVESYIKF